MPLFGNDWSYSHPRRFTREERSPSYASDRRLSALRSRCGRCGEGTLILLEIEPAFPDCPAPSLITVVNELNKLLCISCRCYDLKGILEGGENFRQKIRYVVEIRNLGLIVMKLAAIFHQA